MEQMIFNNGKRRSKIFIHDNTWIDLRETDESYFYTNVIDCTTRNENSVYDKNHKQRVRRIGRRWVVF